VAEYEITCVGWSRVPGGHRHITQVGTNSGQQGWEINRLLARLAAGDLFYVVDERGNGTPAFSDVCSCGFATIRTVDGEYLSVDYLDDLPACS
jgi:hypothetical protein